MLHYTKILEEKCTSGLYLEKQTYVPGTRKQTAYSKSTFLETHSHPQVYFTISRNSPFKRSLLRIRRQKHTSFRKSELCNFIMKMNEIGQASLHFHFLFILLSLKQVYVFLGDAGSLFSVTGFCFG